MSTLEFPNHAPLYPVTTQGKQFVLSKAQITSDGPNAFTRHFLDFKHPYDSSKGPPPMVLDRDPTLFALLVAHMSGYVILPLSERGLPSGMSVAAALRNLVSDAKTLRLNKLGAMLAMPRLPKQLAAKGWAGVSSQMLPLEDLVDDDFDPPAGTYWHASGGRLTGDDGLPVLVLARDTPLQLIFACDIHEHRRSRLPETSTLTLAFGPLVSSFTPPTGTHATQHLLRGSATPDARLHIDGALCYEKELAEAWAESRPHNYTAQGSHALFHVLRPRVELDGRPNTASMQLDVWANTAVFTVRQKAREETSVGPKVEYELEVYAAKMRTRADLLEQLELSV